MPSTSKLSKLLNSLLSGKEINFCIQIERIIHSLKIQLITTNLFKSFYLNHILAKITCPFKSKFVCSERMCFFMKNVDKQVTVYQKTSDKHNDNVICYVESGVVLCR